jgi:hypothetical protein
MRAVAPARRPPVGGGGRRVVFAQRRSTRARTPNLHLPRSAQQHVPSDSFGGRSPERVAADALRSLFTFSAGKIVLAQMTGSGRGDLASFDKPAHDALAAAMEAWPRPLAHPGSSGEENGPRPASLPADDRPPARGGVAGDAWLAGLARVHPAVARRVMEVRAAYAARDFEWESARRLAVQGTADANVALMKELAYESLAASVGGGGEDGGGGGE